MRKSNLIIALNLKLMEYLLLKLIKKDLHRFLSEIWYVGERSRNDLWFLADGNFGIVKEDVIIAENFKKINQKYGYPKQVNYNTAKKASMTF